MDNNIDKQTDSLKSSGKNNKDKNVAASQNNSSSDNSSSINNRINISNPYESLNQIIQTAIETSQNIQFNFPQGESTDTNSSSSSAATGTGSNFTNTTSSTNSCNSVSQKISNTSTLLQNINNIREQLARLNLDPTQRLYYDNSVSPLLTTLYELSATSATLAASVSVLTTSPVVHPKTSELKDTIHLIYHINEKCEDVYKVLKRRLDTLIDMC